MPCIAPHETNDAPTLERFLRANPGLYAYHLGDLDEPYWSRSRWFLNGACALLYDDLALLALCPQGAVPRLEALLRDLLPHLPPSFHLHLTPGLESAFEGQRSLALAGQFRRMVRPPAPMVPPSAPVEWLTAEDEAEAREFYAEAYPDNWFDPRMLATDCYAAVRDAQGRLAAIAGVHVVSQPRAVAALGNIATHPAHRGRGLATRATQALVAKLGAECLLALNVRAENEPARSCYRKLGFRDYAHYREYSVSP